jgi:hypothetical protein
VLAAVVLMVIWSARQFWNWLPLGSDFPLGWRSATAPAVTLVLFAFAVLLLPAQSGRLRAALLTAVLLTVAVEYKVYGTSKWFNADAERVRRVDGPPPAVDDAVYRQMLSHSESRVALDMIGLLPEELRHWGLTTPQGFDPFLPTHYRRLIGRIAHFRSNWELDLDPGNATALHLLGVRYFISSEAAPLYSRLSRNPDFRLLEPSQPFHKVFEFTRSRPSYELIAESSPAAPENTSERRPEVNCTRWDPEIREFVVRSEAGARLVLSEQFFPGWQATVDGSAGPVDRWREAFLSVRVPPGSHRVAFRFRSPGLRRGALLSLVAAFGLVIAATRRFRPGRAKS